MNATPLFSATASLALSASLAMTSSADPWVYDASAKTLSRGTVVLQNVSASGSNLTIGNNQSNATADAIDLSVGVADGYAVTRFASEAFKGNAAIREVILPDTLVALGGNATFRQCPALTNAVFNSGCSMGKLEFYSCTALQSVTLHPDMSGEWIGTFQNCTSLAGDIRLPRGVTGMKETFYGTKITSFETLGTALTYIGYQTNGDGDFRNCSKLTNCVLNAGLKTIGTRVFQGCSALGQLTVPDTVEVFTANFYGCSSLTNVVMPRNLKTIGNRTFSGSKKCNVWWRAYPENGFTFGGDSTRDPMWDAGTAGTFTNWIRIADKARWEAAAAAYPNNVKLPAETASARGTWRGGYSGSRDQILAWWFDDATILIVR